MKEIIIATKNKNKIKELRRLFEPYDVVIHSLPEHGVPEIIEDGKTFEENSIKKAKTIFELFGKPTIADDSGLLVVQLNNEPGIYSSRYAREGASDAENNAKLLRKLANFPEPHPAKFYCAASYFDGKNTIIVHGILKGRIIEKPRGENGFGYDPLFVPDGLNKTLAELPLEEKNKISHRARAFEKLKQTVIDELKLL